MILIWSRRLVCVLEYTYAFNILCFTGISYFVYFYWYSGLTQLIKAAANVIVMCMALAMCVNLFTPLKHTFCFSFRRRLCPPLIISLWLGWLDQLTSSPRPLCGLSQGELNRNTKTVCADANVCVWKIVYQVISVINYLRANYFARQFLLISQQARRRVLWKPLPRFERKSD